MKKNNIEEEKLKKINAGAGIGGGKDRIPNSKEASDKWNYKWIPANANDSETKEF